MNMRVEHHAKCTHLFSTSYYVCKILYYVFVYFNNIKMAKYYLFKHFFEICLCLDGVVSKHNKATMFTMRTLC